MFFKIDAFKSSKLYLKETPTQVFSSDSCDIFKNSFFNRTPLVSLINICLKTLSFQLLQGAYIKYVGGGWGEGEGGGGFYKFFKRFFVAQETIDLNISWPSEFLRKYFMAPPINFSFLFKAYLQQYFRVVLSNIQISNHERS